MNRAEIIGSVVGVGLVLGVGGCIMRVGELPDDSGPRIVECRVYPQATSDRFGFYYDFVNDEPCDADAGDRMDIVLNVLGVSDQIADDWALFCMDSGGELRANPATGDSFCRDVDF